jgi:hypothetical protein
MKLTDERIAFYLRNRERIEEWASIRNEASRAVDEWITSIQPEIERLASDVGATFFAASSTENAWPGFRLSRATWGRGPAGNAVSIGLEWSRGHTNLCSPNLPYVGLRASKATDFGISLRETASVRGLRSKRKDFASAWWVAYSYVEPQGEFPELRVQYREVLIDRLRDAWDSYSPIVDTVVGE